MLRTITTALQRKPRMESGRTTSDRYIESFVRCGETSVAVLHSAPVAKKDGSLCNSAQKFLERWCVHYQELLNHGSTTTCRELDLHRVSKRSARQLANSVMDGQRVIRCSFPFGAKETQKSQLQLSYLLRCPHDCHFESSNLQ